MKRVMFFMAILMMVQVSYSQYAVLNYMKVPPGGDERYVNSEKYAQKVMEKRVEDGKMYAWYVYRVHSQASESEYQYVTVDVYPSISESLKGITWDEARSVLGDEFETARKEINESREMLYRETLGLVTGIRAREDENFLLISYMQAQHPSAYLAMENDVFKLVHQVAIDKDAMVGWGVWRPVLFDGNNNYTALTVNGYSSLDQLDKIDYSGWINTVTEGKSDQEKEKIQMAAQNSDEYRTIVRSQVWELVMSATPPEE